MKDRIILQAEQSEWPSFNPDCLDPDIVATFINRKKAVDMYIGQVKLTIIEDATGIRAQEILRLIDKCFSKDENGECIGYAALVKFKRTKTKETKIDRLFKLYPDLKNLVIGNYTGDKSYTLEHNMGYSMVHKKFVNACRAYGIQDYEYPFCLNDNGYRAIVNYLQNYKNQNMVVGMNRENKNAIQKIKTTGTGDSNYIIPIYPYNIVQVDGHRIDLMYSVEIVGKNGDIIRKNANRAWLLLVIDVASRAIIGYAISPYQNYNQYDVLTAIKNAIKPHERICHSEYFKYPEEGGFPSEYISETEWALFDHIMLDNAKSHLTDNVRNKLAVDYKITVNYGAVGTPETRSIVERVFRKLEEGGFHRLPGTTGSSIKDAKRVNPESEVVKYEITYEDIEEITEYFIAKYNNSAHDALENRTPLQVLRSKIKDAHFLPDVIRVEDRDKVERLNHAYERKVFRGGYHNGERPHINYNKARYYPIDMELPMSMVKKDVMIEIDPDDVSGITAYSLDGEYICDLVARGIYGRIPHSLRERKLASEYAAENKKINEQFAPDITDYENELRERSAKKSTARTKASIFEREKAAAEKKKQDKQDTSVKETTKFENDSDKVDEKGMTAQGYDENILKKLNEMSIEEAYKKGLI